MPELKRGGWGFGLLLTKTRQFPDTIHMGVGRGVEFLVGVRCCSGASHSSRVQNKVPHAGSGSQEFATVLIL